MYLAVVIDLYSRQVVGWSMAERMQAKLVNDTLTMAIWKRKPAQGLNSRFLNISKFFITGNVYIPVMVICRWLIMNCCVKRLNSVSGKVLIHHHSLVIFAC